MYCVVRGEKLFTLLPPSDVLFLYEQEYPSGRYRQRRGERGERGEFEVELERGETVPWIPVGEAFVRFSVRVLLLCRLLAIDPRRKFGYYSSQFEVCFLVLRWCW